MKHFLILFIVIPTSLFSQENEYISNKDYMEFVTYVRDSLLRKTMGEEIDEDYYLNNCYTCEESYVPTINWKAKLDLNLGTSREALEPFYYEPSERLNRKREFDTRKFIHNKVKIYPDELVWCRDTTINKSWGLFLAKYYFTHRYFENYPVQGLSKQQIQEYVKWKYSKIKKEFHLTKTKRIELILPKEKLQFSVGEYYKFYKYTRDSITRMILCREIDEDKYCKNVNQYYQEISPPIVKWKSRLNWSDERVVKTLRNHMILGEDSEIDNRLIIYSYSWLNYCCLDEKVVNDRIFEWESINLGANDYIKETSPINIKKQTKNKALLDFDKIDVSQLRAYYYWKKSDFPKKDVFESFIPQESDIELLRKGKLKESFYSFEHAIPIIQIK